jgi:protoheme IX farnesyltransferase
MFKTYYLLTKPGIIRGNLVTAIAGFFLASQGHVRGWLLLETMVGVSLVIASGCVFNNYIDRGIDAKMERTKKRALVNGSISATGALVYASVLGAGGFLVLAWYTNLLTVVLGLLGLFFYVVVYGVGKRRGVYGTVIGSISGALPPVAGYTAVSGRLDAGAAILFLILVCWQMPHFYAIALYRLKDYAAAGLPVLPVVKGPRTTKIQIMAYIITFTVAAVALTAFGYAGFTYLAVVILLGAGWLGLGARGFRAGDDQRWARKMFLFSLAVIMILSLTISLNAWLP